MERRVHPGNDRTPVTSGYLAAITTLLVVALAASCATPPARGTALAAAHSSSPVADRIAPLPAPRFQQAGLPTVAEVAAAPSELTVPAAATLAGGRGPIAAADLIASTATAELALRAPQGMRLSPGPLRLTERSAPSGVAAGALLAKGLAELAASRSYASRAPLPVPSMRNLAGVPVEIAGNSERQPAAAAPAARGPKDAAQAARPPAQIPNPVRPEVATAAAAPGVRVPVRPAPAPIQSAARSQATPAAAQALPPASGSVAVQPNRSESGSLPPVQPPVSDAKPVPQASLPVSEHLTGNLGSNMSVSFPGDGWIYLGTADATDAVKFVNKSLSKGETRFLFRIVTPGDYTLMFQRQNLATGTQESRNIAIKIVPPANGIAGGGAPGYAEGGGAPLPLPSSADATTVAQSGSAPAVPAAAAPSTGTPVQPSHLKQGTGTTGTALWGAAAEKAQGGQPAAGTNASSAAGSPGPAGGQAVTPQNATAAASTGNAVPQVSQPLTSASIPAGSTDSAGVTQPANVPQFDLGTPSGMLAAATYDLAHSKMQEAEKLLTDYLSKYGYTDNADEAYFLLGKLYEQDSSLRDIRKSIDYYTKLRDQYPFSSYWEEAGRRIQYLNQHFIYVR